jgi:hypothetical protein
MAQAECPPLTADARVRALVSSRGICSGQNWQWDRYFPDIFGFSCQCHSTMVLHASPVG